MIKRRVRVGTYANVRFGRFLGELVSCGEETEWENLKSRGSAVIEVRRRWRWPELSVSGGVTRRRDPNAVNNASTPYTGPTFRATVHLTLAHIGVRAVCPFK